MKKIIFFVVLLSVLFFVWNQGFNDKPSPQSLMFFQEFGKSLTKLCQIEQLRITCKIGVRENVEYIYGEDKRTIIVFLNNNPDNPLWSVETFKLITGKPEEEQETIELFAFDAAAALFIRVKELRYYRRLNEITI
ncbi:MAG: hypothetical protein LiPW39_426 [Parcubacteria group bacterium LiPW_39]|nr:MAG: hypothetical protein LiPW39_426 [Parcubacteria group bacterium LiPW_39]